MLKFYTIPLLILGIAGCKSRETAEFTVYYVDNVTGNDATAGTSPEKAWKSLERVNMVVLKAGDKVLLKGGQIFQGSLKFKSYRGSGTAPIIISSFGESRAVIESGDSVALHVENCSHIICKNLIIKGSGRLAGNKADGLLFQDVKHGMVDSVEASGYLYSGIHIKGGDDISITHAYSHDNGFSGIFAESGEPEYGTDGSAFRTLNKIYIGYSVAENNPGCPVFKDNHSGNGILIAGVSVGLIEYCEAMNNGWAMPREGNGPVGIWAYMSDSVIIQHCYAHHNKTSAHGKDGGGFDFDGGIRNSILQYNLSAFNEGAGYGIFQYAGATEWSGNIARYNISYNDGSKNSHAGIFMWCDPAAEPMKNFHAYNNTIVSSYGLGVNFEPGAYEGFIFENNIFLITGETERFVGGNYTRAVFNHNLYWSACHSGSHKQQPLQNADHDPVQADPLLVLPGNQMLSDMKPESLTTLSWFGLAPGSPGLKAGKPVQHYDGMDFWGNPVSSDENPNMGAWQGD